MHVPMQMKNTYVSLLQKIMNFYQEPRAAFLFQWFEPALNAKMQEDLTVMPISFLGKKISEKMEFYLGPRFLTLVWGSLNQFHNSSIFDSGSQLFFSIFFVSFFNDHGMLRFR